MVLTVTLPGHPHCYDIVIEPGLLKRSASAAIQAVLPQRQQLLVITHRSLWDLLAPDLTGFEIHTHFVPEGETTKSLEQLNGIWLAAQQAGLTRRDAFVALGGGVIGDLTGFAASTYYRGVPFVQIPTTLLAQVDSSVGGKTGINVGPIKNSVGVFNQPALVLIDPQVLQTLPPRELTAGLAEVLKYGLIESTCCNLTDAPFWAQLAHYPDRAALMADMDDIIHTCCRIKAAVVMQDETEQLGLRAILNLGHTFGHALEADGQYTTYLHGEAVAIGTLWACRFAQQQGYLSTEQLTQVETVWQRLDMPTKPLLSHQPTDLLARMRQDKKNDTTDHITLILPKPCLGQVVVCKTIALNQLMTFLVAQTG
jgi:3-dehydroquinate synthase